MDRASGDLVQVAEAFATVARALASRHDVQSMLDAVVRLAVESLDSCEHAGISRITQRRITSPASSGEVPRVIDRIQEETGEGPCLDAIRSEQLFETGDLQAETRWPRFSKRAHEETGVCSILAVRLFAGDDTMGALNVYSSQRDAFDDTDIALAAVFAAHAALAVSSVRREVGLEEKARSRDLIGQAKGMIMARSSVDEDQAFDMLRHASQRMNVKVKDIAEQIVGGKPWEGPTS